MAVARPAYSEPEVDEIRGRIRAVALQIFQEQGYRSASLRKIATAMGWSSAAIYRYYAGKDELFAAIRVEGFARIREVLASERRKADSPAAAVRGTVQSYLRFAIEEPGLYRLMYELDQGEVPARDDVHAARQRAFEEARGIADDAIAAGIMRGDRNVVAHMFWIVVHGAVALELAGQLNLGVSLDDLTDPILALLNARLEAIQGGQV
jgi:AcrR family transcriptional regulator